jgi:hypothetical protein
LNNVIAGRTRYYKGWSLFCGDVKAPIEKNAKIFDIILISPDGEQHGPISNLTKFCRDNNIEVSSVRKLISGKIKKGSYKGWRFGTV